MIEVTRLREIIRDCLFTNDEDTSTAILVEGVVRKFGFHPERLRQYKSEIADMLRQLPNEFHNDGWSFLNACVDQKGNQWGEHKDIEELFVLGEALGLVKCLMPRELWGVLPGGMPYYMTIGCGGNITPIPPIIEETE